MCVSGDEGEKENGHLKKNRQMKRLTRRLTY